MTSDGGFMDTESKLRDLLKKRNKLKSDIERLKGRREAAIKERDRLRQECTDKGVDPDKLDEIIPGLEAKLEGAVEQIKQNIEEAENQLRPLSKR
jgi:chromosome segregation ATPase